MPQEIRFSISNLLQIVVVLLILYLLFQVRDILVLFFVAIILKSALEPMADNLEKNGIPRWGSILIIYFFTLFVLLLFLQGVIEPMIRETQEFIGHLPRILEEVIVSFNLSSFIDQNQLGVILKNFVSSFSVQLISTPLVLARLGISFFSGLLSVLSVFVLTFYLILDSKMIKKWLSLFFPKERREVVMEIINRSEGKLGKWMRGEFFLMFVVGLAIFVGLTILGVPFALPLAVMAGLLEIVPILGPTFSTIPPLIIALSESPIKGLGVVVLFLLVQQTENHLLVPQVMRGAVGLHPLLVILALLVGGTLLGPVGALLSVPVAVTLWVVFDSLHKTEE